MGIVSEAHFVYNFSRNMFIMLNSINWLNSLLDFIYLLRCRAIFVMQLSVNQVDIINFEINLIFLIKFSSDLKQGKRLLSRQGKSLICRWWVTFIWNLISVTLSKSTLVSEFTNDVDFALSKRCPWHFQNKSSCCQVMWHTAHIQTVNKQSKLRTAENGWK